MKKNDIFEINITGITEDGDGVGRAEGMAVFVPYALMGETVRVVIIKVLKNYAIGKLEKVISPSPERQKAECEYFYKCGGCKFWNVSYKAELDYKRQKVEDSLRRIGGITLDVPPVLGAESVFDYRNKGQFPVSEAGIGLYAKHSHRVIDVSKCMIQDSETENVLKCIREWMKEYNIPPYNEEKNEGCVRHIYTRSADSGKLVCIVTNGKELPFKDELIEKLTQNIPGLSGILQNINSKKTNVVLGKDFKTLWGEDFIIDSIGNSRFKISPHSFYQVNKKQTEVLYGVARDFAQLSGNEIVWDLYCGIGTIGQFMADKAKEIIGIEVVPEAIENAKENKNLNKIQNAKYYCGTAEGVAPKLKGHPPDVVILDPPRKGCEESLLKTVAKTKAKKIVYVSCKPSTLARDLKILEGLGYKTKKIQPVDMFPRTTHVECVSLLTREI